MIALSYQQNSMNTHKISRRHIDILERLRQHGTSTIADLARALNVSEETIRRDSVPLQQRGDVLKLHGSLSLPHQVGEAPFERRLREYSEAKRAIARRAAMLVADGDSLILDTGTTTSIFAQELLKKRGLTLVTNSADIAKTLATVNGNKVYLAGGELNGANGAAFGASTVAYLSNFQVTHTFISISALHPEFGPMDMYIQEAEFARMALTRASHRVMLTDASKFGQKALVKICDFKDVDRLITNAIPDPALSAALQAAGVAVNVVAGN
jgi:DeoR family transcriptional regulator, glycerol-3-phosphate regulon repressor